MRGRVLLKIAAPIFAAVIAIVLIIIKTTDFDIKQPTIGFDAEFWFRESETLRWVKETRRLGGGYDKALFDSALTALWAGPRSNKLQRSIPRFVDNADSALIVRENADGTNSRVAVLNFNNTYRLMSDDEQAYCLASAVWSLTSLRFVDAVRFTIDGEPLTTANGRVVGTLTRGDVRLDVFTTAKAERVAVTLYYPKQDGSGIALETREAERGSGEPLETRIIRELAREPITIGLSAALPKNVAVNSTRVDNGVCFVDLTADFTERLDGVKYETYLVIQSIVASLTELPDVDKVQFLINGDRVEPSGWLINFSTPFERDDDVIIG